MISGGWVGERAGTAVSASLKPNIAALWQPVTLIIFAAWVIIVGSHHEPWFDEVQAWLIARDSGLVELFAHNVRYEGTPGLWHGVLWCAIRLGLPFAQVHMLPAASAIGAAAIILWRSPFPPLLRVAIVTSWFFAYQFAVVARGYTLDLLLIPLLAMAFERRTEKPLRYALLLGLIANVNAHSFLAAGVLGLEWLAALRRDKRLAHRPAVLALALAVALGLFALLSAWQPSDNIFLATFPPPLNGLPATASYVREAFLDRSDFWGSVAPGQRGMVNGFILSLVALAASYLLFRRAGHGLLAIGLFVLLTGFSAWKYAYGWHAGVLFLLWIFLLWISWPAARADKGLRRIAIAAMAAILIPQSVQAIRTGLIELDHPFSAGPRVAAEVRDWRRGHPQGRIAAFGFNVFAVQPWFDANIFANYHGGAPRPSYIRWQRAEPWKATVTPSDWDQAIAARPDLLLASLGGMDESERAELARAGCRAGFGPLRVYPASSVWKGYVKADDALGMFIRRVAGAPSPDCGAATR